MGRSARSTAAEARRHRSERKLNGKDECETGHPAMFAVNPTIELERMPEGGGYPVGFVEWATQILGAPEPTAVVHLCSGSIQAPLTFDYRALDVGAAVACDVRWLPIRPESVRGILVDPPYGDDYAEALWGLGKRYPSPTVLLRECAQVLTIGGRVGFLHHVVPRVPDGLERVGTFGVSTGPGYRMRAFTVAEKCAPALTLDGV